MKKILSLAFSLFLLFSLFLIIKNLPQKQIVEKQALTTPDGSGDFVPDKIFGKSDFGETVPNQVTGNRVFLPAGITIDRGTRPNRLYIWDSGNSRILGFSSLGICPTTSSLCTNDSDCVDGSRCQINSTKNADIIIGQPSPYHASCNGDSTQRNPPSAATLCSQRYPYQISLFESPEPNNMAVDDNHNLYVADKWNQRVLRYNDPFATDQIADQVWGQSNFNSKECNQGNSYPDQDTICFDTNEKNITDSFFWGAGLDVQPDGTLWVVDGANHRVLRFPPNSGYPQGNGKANLVLGQPNFTSKANFGCTDLPSPPDAPLPPTNYLCRPKAVRYNRLTGQVFVLDWAGRDHQKGLRRILIYNPPFTNGQASSEVIYADTDGSLKYLGNRPNTSYFKVFKPSGLEMDPFNPDAFWLNDSGADRAIYIQKMPNGKWQPTKVIGKSSLEEIIGRTNYNCPNPNGPPFLCQVEGPSGGIGIDSAGNIYLNNNKEQHILRFPAPIPTPNSTMIMADAIIVQEQPYAFGHPGANFIGPAGIHGPNTILLVNYPNGTTQMLVDDRHRVLVWNNYDSLPNGSPANFVLFQEDFFRQEENGGPSRPNIGGEVRQMTADSQGRIWMARVNRGVWMYQGPINESSQSRGPDLKITLEENLKIKNSPLTLRLGEVVGVVYDEQDQALWVADGGKHRVVRILHPLTEKIVDLVIGQPNIETTLPNRGQDNPATDGMSCPHMAPDGFATMGQIKLDNYGNLYVIDTGHEGWQCSNNRLLEFDRVDILQKIQEGRVFFDDPNENNRLLPRRVYGTSGFYPHEKNKYGSDNYPNFPFSVSFTSKNDMLITVDGYGNDPLKRIYFLNNPLRPCPSEQERCHIDEDFILLEAGLPLQPDRSYFFPISIAQPADSSIDKQGNIAIIDHTWNRILYFKNPYQESVPTPTFTPTPTPTSTPTPTPCPRGDLGNVDCQPEGIIDSRDLDIFLSYLWNPQGPVLPPPAGYHHGDLNGDNKVDEVDLLILLSNWGPPPYIPTATRAITLTPTPTRVPTSSPTPTPTPYSSLKNCPNSISVEDSFIDQYAPTVNYDNPEFSNNQIRLYKSNIATPQRGLIKFDLSKISLPINKAYLRVYVAGWGGEDAIINVYQIKQPWKETEVTWNKADNSTPWQKPGAEGENDRSLIPTASVSTNGINRYLNIDITNLVKSWLAQPQTNPNHGVMLILGTPNVSDSSSNKTIILSSSESPDPNLRPCLIIE